MLGLSDDANSSDEEEGKMKSIDVNQLSIISEESITAVENYFHKLLTVEEEKVPALILLQHVRGCVKLLPYDEPILLLMCVY